MINFSEWFNYPSFRGILFSLVGLVVLYAVIRIWGWILDQLDEKILQWKGSRIKDFKFQKVTLLGEDQIVLVLENAISAIRWISYFFIFATWLIVTFNFFPSTENLADQIIHSYILEPIQTALMDIVSYIPKLVLIALIILATRFLLKGVKFFFSQIENGSIRFKSFHRDWAQPTYQLARALIFVFALIMIFPYLPASNSDAFKGISVFVGVLVSFGSSSAIGNMIAGLVLTYMRPFKVNDFVKISDTMGVVVERSLLVTRIVTPKKEEVTIPSAQILSHHIVNYSSYAKKEGVVFHTRITIGYDTPWKDVYQAMIAAAERTPLIEKTPKPFVLQTALNDSYVEYELNAHTKSPEVMPQIYSDLHQNLQDTFNEVEIEIMSPTYFAMRKGDDITIPHGQTK